MSTFSDYINAHKESIVEDWAELVNTEGKADELENMAEVAALLKAKFEKAGFVCELKKTHEGAPDVLTGILGAGARKRL